MERRGTGRDVWLTLRMAIVLTGLLAFYGGLFAVAGLIAWNDNLLSLCIPVMILLFTWLRLRSAALDTILSTHAREVGRADEPELTAAVERLAALADMPAPPLALSRFDAPNALAVGSSAKRSVVVVTEGLRERLDPRELEAVLAHELSHLANRDSVVLTWASSFRVLGAFFGDLRYIDPDAEYDTFDRVRLGFARVLFAPFRWALLAVGIPLTLALSRYREYAADRGSALLTGHPEYLASALQKLAGADAAIPQRDLRRTAGVQAFWIVPVERARLAILADHPPLEKRLARLARIGREMGRAVTWA